MNLAVVIDDGDANDCRGLRVTGEQHPTHDDTSRIAGVTKQTPAIAIVVLCVEIRHEVDLGVDRYVLAHLTSHDTG